MVLSIQIVSLLLGVICFVGGLAERDISHRIVNYVMTCLLFFIVLYCTKF